MDLWLQLSATSAIRDPNRPGSGDRQFPLCLYAFSRASGRALDPGEAVMLKIYQLRFRLCKLLPPTDYGWIRTQPLWNAVMKTPEYRRRQSEDA
jgi:hypothetical protein